MLPPCWYAVRRRRGPRLPGGDALGGRLEPVVDGVPHEMRQGIGDALDDGAVDSVLAAHLERRLLAERRRDVADDAREAREERAHRQHA